MQLALEKAGIDSSIFKDTVNDAQNSIENLTPEQVEEIKRIERSGEKVSRFTKNIFLQI